LVFRGLRGGAVYDFVEYQDMLRQAGFTDIQDVSDQPIKATKHSATTSI
jgi:hypothetical protein